MRFESKFNYSREPQLQTRGLVPSPWYNYAAVYVTAVLVKIGSNDDFDNDTGA